MKGTQIEKDEISYFYSHVIVSEENPKDPVFKSY